MTEPAVPNLTIVVPAFNEGANITPVVREIVDTLAANPWVGPYEVVLVDDGSRDDTGAVMERLKQEFPQLSVWHHETNRGFGAALRTGFTRSRGKAVSLVTADGEVGVDQMLRLFRELGDADLILNRRERPVVTLGRRILTIGVDWMIRLILGYQPDKVFGIYVVRGDLVRSMRLHSDTGLANLEIVLNCRDQGRRIVISDSALIVRPRLSGQSKVTNSRTIIQTLKEMLQLRLRRRRTQRG